MIHPKEFLNDIYRTPPETFNRTEYLRLDKNEDVVGLSKEFIEIVSKNITPDFLASHPNYSYLYKKISEKLNVDENNILVSMGSEGAIKRVFEVFLNPNDEVVIPYPNYAMYEILSNLFQVKLIKCLYDTQLNLNVEEIVSKITDNTKLVIISNPNSPTGSIIDDSYLISIIEKANEKNTLILIDEAYYPYYEKTSIDYYKKYDNVIVTRTFSKACSLASLRIGYAVSNSYIINCLNSFRPMYEVTGISALFAASILEHPELVRENILRVQEGKKYIINEMSKLGFKTYKSYTNFINIEVGEENVEKIVKHMFENKILIKAGSSHETLNKCIRVSIGPPEVMKRFVKEIKRYYSIEKNTIL